MKTLIKENVHQCLLVSGDETLMKLVLTCDEHLAPPPPL